MHVPLYCSFNFQNFLHVSLSITRFIARVLLVPFPFQAPEVELGALHNVLEAAPAAFPVLLRLGHQLINNDREQIYSVRRQIEDVIRKKSGQADSRLMTQYAISIAMAQKASCCTVMSGMFHVMCTY